MRRPYNFCILVAATAASSVIPTGCQKDAGLLKHLECAGCNIEQITVDYSTKLDTSAVSYVFTYNADGDPVDIKNSYVTTGNPNSVFHYDKHGRLIEFIRPYSNQNFETWTRYVYNNKGQAIRDTQYSFGTYVDSVPVPHYPTSPWIHEYSYDALNRIIAVKSIDYLYTLSSPPYISIDSFKYGADGNLVTGAQYDNHPSILLTNRIWPFLCRNYSVNNGFPVTTYNRSGFPLTFEGWQDLMPLVSYSGTCTVKYSCK